MSEIGFRLAMKEPVARSWGDSGWLAHDGGPR